MSSISRDIRTKRAMIISSEQFPFQPLVSVCGFELVFSKDSHEAIVMAAQGQPDYIFIQVNKMPVNPESFLTALRKASPGAALVLLCAMVEEPRAMRLVHAQQEAYADEYVIFPSGLDVWIHDHCGLQAIQHPITNSSPASLEHLEKLAVEDDLTGLKNRRYLRQFLKQILQYAEKEKLNVTLLLFDIDNFKLYNDQYGHPVGDEVLRQVGKMIKSSCRTHDVVARVGGDEFAVVFWDLPLPIQEGGTAEERRKLVSEHPRETIFMAQRFRRQLSMAKLSVLGASGKGHLTISGGLASFPKDGKDEQELFLLADQAMLHAKRSGKNRIHIVGTEE